MSDPVNHPKHYNNHPSGIECIEVVRHMTFNLGNAIKYIWRADEKGKDIEDLEKAIFYIKDEIEKRSKIQNSNEVVDSVKHDDGLTELADSIENLRL